MELKQFYAEMRSAWEEMKHTLEEQAAEVKANGAASQETRNKIAELNDRIDRYETELKRMPTPVGPSGATVSQERAAFIKAVKYGMGAISKEEKDLVKIVSLSEAKALSLGDDTAGGYLAPPEFVNDIIKSVILFSPIRTIATVRQTANRSVLMPVRTGTFAATWVAETGQRSETPGLKYGREEIPTHEMYAEILISEQDLEDSAFDMDAQIMMESTEQFGVAEGAAFVNGTGTGQPEGLLSAPGIGYVPSTDAANVTANGLINIAYALKDAYARNATWLMKRKTVGLVRELTVGGTSNNFLWQPGLQAGAPSLLLDRPYIETVDMPDVASNAFPVMFGDFSRGYVIVDRVAMVVKRLQEKYAETGQIAVLVRKRVGGQVVLNEAILKQKISVS